MDKLNVLMRDIVEKEVKHYQSDIEIDFKIIKHDNKDYKTNHLLYKVHKRKWNSYDERRFCNS